MCLNIAKLKTMHVRMKNTSYTYRMGDCSVVNDKGITNARGLKNGRELIREEIQLGNCAPRCKNAKVPASLTWGKT